jgi:hypothetical protein
MKKYSRDEVISNDLVLRYRRVNSMGDRPTSLLCGHAKNKTHCYWGGLATRHLRHGRCDSSLVFCMVVISRPGMHERFLAAVKAPRSRAMPGRTCGDSTPRRAHEFVLKSQRDSLEERRA